MTETKNIEHTTRKQIAEFLPEAIELAVKSYKEFMQEGHGTKANGQPDFVDHHKSAKIAISHIELLIKLAKWADLPDATDAIMRNSDAFKSLMAAAEAEIAAYEGEV